MKKRTRNSLIIAVFIVVFIAGIIFIQKDKNQTDTAKEDNLSKVAAVSTSAEDLEEDTDEVEEEVSEEGDTELEEAEEAEVVEETEPEEEVVQEEVTEETETIKEVPALNEAETTEETEEPIEESVAEKVPEKKETSPKKEKSPEKVQGNHQPNVSTIEYLLPFTNSEERVESTSHVVLHFSSNALNKPKDPYRIEDTYDIFKEYGVSAHYVIGRGGEIYMFVPENRFAYHAGRGRLPGFPEIGDQLNRYSIGIELLGMGTREEMIPMITAAGFDLVDPSMTGFTESQYGSLNTLLNDIVARYPNVKKNRSHIVGHDEYSVGLKTDPGSLFEWSKIGL